MCWLFRRSALSCGHLIVVVKARGDLSRAFSAMSCPRDLVKSCNSPTTAGKGWLDSCSELFVLTTKRVSPVRMRRPSVGNTASCFCSKSGNRSSLAQMGKFDDHAAEETSSLLNPRRWRNRRWRDEMRSSLGR